jgi:DNA-directed RNA polymerase subunit H (RpoH/RPB5)
MNSERVSKIYTSRLVLLDQLKEAGYITSAYENASIEEVNAMDINVQLDMLLPNQNGTKIYVNYIGDDRFSDRSLTTLCNNIFGDNSEAAPILTKEDILMIIMMVDITETLSNTLMRIYDRYGYYVIPRTIDQLQFNILRHERVPRHAILTPDALDVVLRRYRIDTDNLPKISRFDPAAKAICIRPSQVCEITRPSSTAISTKFYRVCINAEFMKSTNV